MKMTITTVSPWGKFLHIFFKTTFNIAPLSTYFLKLHLISSLYPLMYNNNTMVGAFTSKNQFTLDHPISDFNEIVVILEMAGGSM